MNTNHAAVPKYSHLAAVQADLLAQRISCQQLVVHYLEQIAATQHLNIYLEVFADEALRRAAELDEKYRHNPSSVGQLFGMVVSLKDVICYENHRVTAASKILEGFTSLFSATAVERILAADAIVIGRVNCDSFGMGNSTENSIYGATRNAANADKVPGGSSGGSAVSVQADTCLASLGSDTGGSVRQPAAFCSVVGMKPTYGRISRHGLIAYASSFDQIGTLTHSVADAALLLQIMAGADDYDSTVSRQAVPNYTNLSRLSHFDKKVKIAYFADALDNQNLDPDIAFQTKQFVAQLQAEGHRVEAVEFPYLDYLIPAYYVLTTAEASSNLSRYDGVRYGFRAENTKNLTEHYQKTRSEGFHEEVKRRIMLGTFVLSAGHYEAYYTKAQQIRRLVRDKTCHIFSEYDFILIPTSPVAAWNIGEKQDDPVASYLADIFTVQANMAGVPAIALPIGVHSEGTGIGIQLMANHFCEADLLAFAAYVMDKLTPKKANFSEK